MIKPTDTKKMIYESLNMTLQSIYIIFNDFYFEECPKSGILLSEAIRMSPRPQRKAKCIEALKKCDNDPYILAAVAELFLMDRKVHQIILNLK